MKNLALSIFLMLTTQLVVAQSWIDTTFQISTTYDIEYGTTVDFQGADYVGTMDISVPANGNLPECGRPLMVLVHGGAFYGGDKTDGNIIRMRKDFAKRGYVTAAVNYRLGMFNTDQTIDCVLDGWKCWNMTDTSEWYRAYYRAIQDVRGAIRYLVNEKETYQINPDNIFLVGESAGGFIALGTGYIDDDSEVLASLIGDYPDAPAPNAIYENSCIRASNLANSIDEMSLGRPDLGSLEGELNWPVAENYRIRGVGNIYGGVFNDIFESHTGEHPALYMFHQPCDLIVPFGYNKVVAGFSSCATGFPTFCQHIVNRPFIYGSGGIANLIDGMADNNIPVPDYFFDNTGNNFSCAEQVLNPSVGCHAFDNYWQRTNNMAAFFSTKLSECSVVNTANLNAQNKVTALFPNPVTTSLNIQFHSTYSTIKVRIMDVLGKMVLNQEAAATNACSIDMSGLGQGAYRVLVEAEDTWLSYSVVKI